jgi:hypothetical protein
MLAGPVVLENSIRLDSRGETESAHHRIRLAAIVQFLATYVANLFKSRRRLALSAWPGVN